MLKRFFVLLLDLLYPQDCLICRQSAYWLCPTCLERIEIRSDTLSIEELNETYIACDYNSHLKSIIWSFKYANQPEAALLLSELLWRRVQALTLPSSLYLVAIPLSPSKLKFRGYNQAELLAQQLAEKTGLRLINPLHRVKKVRQQAHLNRDERLKNTADAFRSDQLSPDVSYLLVDDVLTTGATISAAARALRRAGARNIIGLAVTRNDRKN